MQSDLGDSHLSELWWTGRFICSNFLSLCLGVVAEQKDYVAEGIGQDSAEKVGLVLGCVFVKT